MAACVDGVGYKNHVPETDGRRARGNEMSDMPKLDRVIETCLYVDDLGRAARFYEEALGLKALTYDERFRAYDVGGQSVPLLFRRGGTLKTETEPAWVW